jgi:DNA primase
MELEREIAEATETDDAGRIEQVISALHEVQLEVARMENQEAIIDGFGVMSGRVKGPATGHG